MIQANGNLRCIRNNRNSRGFTLIEVALATIIVGVGIVSSIALFATCAKQNRAAADMTTAMLLTSNIREMMTGVSFNDPETGKSNFGPENTESLANYDDIDDFDGRTCNPPLDSTRAAVGGMSQYTQVITVVPVYANKPNSNNDDANLEIPKTTYTGAVRVRVRVLYQRVPTDAATEVYRASWVRMDR